MAPQTLTVLNPFDLTPVDSISEQTADDIDALLEASYALFRQRDTWLPLHQRIDILEHCALLMEKRFDQLTKVAVLEGGKPLIDTRVEVVRSIDTIKSVIAALRSHHGQSMPAGLTPATEHHTAFTRTEPLGVVVAISAFNHPINLIVHQVAPAVAAGCPVIVKPAASTPLSCLAFLEILYDAGLPKDWAQAIVTSDHGLTERLATDHRVGFLSFVGSAGVGWSLRSKLTPGARCALKHGGAAPVIMTGDTDIYEVSEAILKGCFYHAGQAGESVQRIFAHTNVATRFSTQLAMKAAGLRLGNPMNPETEVGPLIHPEEVSRIHEWVTEAVNGGGQLLTGGEQLSETIYAPTVIFNPPSDCRLMTEEAFGPVVCIDPWFNTEDAVNRANALPTAFQAAVFTRDVKLAMEISNQLDASAVMINDHSAFRADWMPLAGLRQSGLGMGNVPCTLWEMTANKTIAIRTGSPVASPDIEPD
tara:strand:- start:22289 stop:23716 length:1428 start_codon:yes stop_codon:yes gene_type:complete